METGTQQPLPHGSPILAYGTSRGPAINRKILALIAGIFVFALAVLGIVLFPPIKLPEQTFLIATVRSGVPLPSGAPSAWTAATQSGLPYILGMTETDAGPEAYSAVLLSTPHTTLHTERHGAFVLISEKPLSNLASTRWISLSALLSKAISAPATLRLIPGVLLPGFDGTIDGPIKGGIWETNIPVASTAQQPLPEGDAAIDIHAFPDAWPSVRSAISGESLSLDAIAPPSTISWSETTGTPSTIDLRYDDGVTSSTILALASQIGLTDSQPLALPDQEVVQELTAPISILDATSTSAWNGDQWSMHLTDTGVRLVRLGVPLATEPAPEACAPGKSVLTINRPLLQNVFQQTGFSLALSVDRITASVSNGKLLFCIP